MPHYRIIPIATYLNASSSYRSIELTELWGAAQCVSYDISTERLEHCTFTAGKISADLKAAGIPDPASTCMSVRVWSIDRGFYGPFRAGVGFSGKDKEPNPVRREERSRPTFCLFVGNIWIALDSSTSQGSRQRFNCFALGMRNFFHHHVLKRMTGPGSGLVPSAATSLKSDI